LTGVDIGDVDKVGCARQREHGVDGGRGPYQQQAAALASRGAGGIDQQVHARGVHELEVAQVEHDQPRVVRHIAQRLVQLRRRRDVQLTGYVDPRGSDACVAARAGGRRRDEPVGAGRSWIDERPRLLLGLRHRCISRGSASRQQDLRKSRPAAGPVDRPQHDALCPAL
jgi:hypothetical protein